MNILLKLFDPFALDLFQKYADILDNIITPLAIIIGGIWAYRKFHIRNERQWNGNMKLEVNIIEKNLKENLVVVNISIENVGNRKITPTENGLVVSLYKAPEGDTGNYFASEWELLEERDILMDYKEENTDEKYSDCWNLDPGATYTERTAIRLKEKGIFRIVSRLHIKDRSMPDKENWLTEYYFFKL